MAAMVHDDDDQRERPVDEQVTTDDECCKKRLTPSAWRHGAERRAKAMRKHIALTHPEEAPAYGIEADEVRGIHETAAAAAEKEKKKAAAAAEMEKAAAAAEKSSKVSESVLWFCFVWRAGLGSRARPRPAKTK